MDRIIQSPGKYIQGAGAIKRLGDYLKPLAERWLVVGDKFVLGFAEEMLRKSLADAGLAAEIAPFGGECSHNEINRLRDIAGNAKCTAVLCMTASRSSLAMRVNPSSRSATRSSCSATTGTGKLITSAVFAIITPVN